METDQGPSPGVQQLRLCTPNAGAMGSVPGRGTRSHTPKLRGHLQQLKDSACHSEGLSVQFSLTLCDPTDCSTPGLPVHHQLSELAQTHVHRVGDATQPSHPLSSPSPLAFNLSQHHNLFQGVSSSHWEAKVLDFQL